MGCFTFYENQKSCQFCDIADGTSKRSKSIVSSFQRILIIPDRNPISIGHYLVIPYQHISDVYALDNSHCDLIKEMEQQGRQFLIESHPDCDYKIGFHTPPSIYHLHMHAIAFKDIPWYKEWRYRGRWWIDATEVVRILENGTKVTQFR